MPLAEIQVTGRRDPLSITSAVPGFQTRSAPAMKTALELAALELGIQADMEEALVARAELAEYADAPSGPEPEQVDVECWHSF